MGPLNPPSVMEFLRKKMVCLKYLLFLDYFLQFCVFTAFQWLFLKAFENELFEKLNNQEKQLAPEKSEEVQLSRQSSNISWWCEPRNSSEHQRTSSLVPTTNKLHRYQKVELLVRTTEWNHTNHKKKIDPCSNFRQKKSCSEPGRKPKRLSHRVMLIYLPQ